ncbi:dystroglycan [Galendromus occidentalis]|uniref:Dystroglycan 1 n=1 Tax=Galendromus occidentalis TaxID=34638 RepID=A0AAJ7L7W5_9ACAR|nr:dystroglycan [Galendromus occidentalis]
MISASGLCTLTCVWAGFGLLLGGRESLLVSGEPHGGHVRLSRKSGIPDTTAYAGYIFNYTLPEDIFNGEVHHYDVTEAGDIRLPGWLQFDVKNRRLIGLPDVHDEGKAYICVKAYGFGMRHQGNSLDEQSVSDEKSTQFKDIFSIEVLPNKLKDPHCRFEPRMTLMVDADLHFLPLESKIEMTCSLANCLGVALESLRLTAMPQSNSLLFPSLHDDSHIRSGAGDGHKRTKSGIQFEWNMPSDCDGQLTAEADEQIKIVETTAKDSTLRHLLRHRVLGWHVRGTSLGGNQVSGFSIMRQRRDMGTSQTPMPGIVVPTATLTNDLDWDSASPDTRIVPSMSSPAVDPSSYAPHPTRHFEEMITPTMTIQSMLPGYGLSTPALPPPRPSFTYVPAETNSPPSMTPIIEPSSTVMYPPPTADPTGRPLDPPSPGSIPEPDPPTVNNKPVVNKRLKKLVLTAGAIFTYKIPAETFMDEEDGDTRGLALELTSTNGQPVNTSSFIQLDKENQTLFALPVGEVHGKHTFFLKAYDSAGESVTETFEVNVWQHPKERNFHHKFKMSVQPRGDWDWAIGWPMDVVRVLSNYFGDGDDIKITIINIDKRKHTISWTNSSLPATPCPREVLKQIEKKLNKDSGEPRGVLIKAMAEKEITIVHISLDMLGLCKTPLSTGAPAENNAPLRRNNIGELEAIVGRFFLFKIPEDTFYDYDDGSTRYLSLNLRNMNGESVTPQSWLQFNTKSQELFGLPEASDLNRTEYIMSAADKLGQEANDVFLVDVRKPDNEKYAVEFSIQFQESIDEFRKNATKKVIVVQKLAKLYNDPDPMKITVTSILNGSTIFTWTNNTLAMDRCPSDAIKALSAKLIEQFPQQQANAGHISRNLVDAMWPDFRVLRADVRPLGACLGAGGVPPSSGISPPLAPKTHPGKQPEDDEVYFTTVIPALVIIFMLVMATAVACCLYSKRRRGKLGLNDNSLYHKGIPIILNEELEDRPHMGGSGGKRPAIMHEERPPLSRDVMAPLLGQGSMHHRSNEPYHQPSPPYVGGPSMGSGARGSRPRGVPSYRNPPPYVPP